MKNIILSFVLLFVAISAFSQSPFLSKKFTKSINIFMWRIQNTPSNGFFMQGHYGKLSSNDSGHFLSQLDSNANVLWAKKMQTKDFKVSFNAATVLKDDNILACYSEKTTAAKSQKIIVKTNSTMSNVIWSLVTTNYVYITGVHELKNGNILIVAEHQVNLSGIFDVVFMLDSDGNLIWQKTFITQTSGSLDNAIFYEIKELNDGQLLLVGYFRTGAYPDKSTSKICKIDVTNGEMIWQNNYKTETNAIEYPYFMNEDKDGNLYFAIDNFVYSNNQSLFSTGMCKIDKDGTPIWRKDYSKESIIGSIVAKPDGTFFANLTDLKAIDYFLNIDTNGNISSQFQDFQNADTGKPFYDKKGNLLLFRGLQRCNDPLVDGYIQSRAPNGKGTCSFPSNLSAIDRKITKVKVGTLSAIANLPLGFEKKATSLLLDLPLATENQAINCHDTVFLNRCEGDLYSVGSSLYNKDGVYVDVIKNQNCADAIISKLAFSKKKNTQLDTTVCEGKSLKIGTKEFTQAGIYKEVLKNKLGCDSIVSIQLKVSKIEIFTPDTIEITEGEEVNLAVTTAEKNLIYEWSPPDFLTCVKCPKTISKPSESIDYTVKGTSKDGCEAEAKINVKVFKRGEVFIPTAFSPDDNGTNDFFTVFGNQGVAKILDFSVFDRWGNQVFNQKNVLPNDPIAGWNGSYKNERVQQGVYIYKIQIEMANGKIRDYSGDVMVN
jgi:gliding motility-associated-like protein